MKVLNIGVIGAGGRGALAKEAHSPAQGSRVVAVCDTNPEALQAGKAHFGPDVFVTQDYRKLLAVPGLDAVFVCSPDWLHEEHGLAVLASGRALYLEKPMAITIEGCDRLILAARKHKSRLYVGHNMRFMSVMLKMKEVIDSGRIGEVQAVWCRHFISYGGDAYFKDWHSERRFTTGLLLQKGAHDIDVIHWLAGGYTRRVVGMGKLSVYNRVKSRLKADEKGVARFDRKNWPPLKQTGLSHIIDVEDHSMVMMDLDNGVQATYLQCHYAPDDQRNYTVIGTQGRIENCGDEPTDGRLATVRLWTWRCGYEEEGTETIKIPPSAGTHGGGDPLIVRDFLHYVRTGRRAGPSPLDARMSVATGCLATQSLREGNRPYDVPAAP